MSNISLPDCAACSFSYLRVMHQQDLPEVLAIERQAYAFPWSQKGFENSLDQGLNFLFCAASGDVLGYACVLTVLDEAHLLNFCIRGECQGKGQAKSAFMQLQQHLQAAQYQVMFLEVRESNHRARCLYQQLGFSEDGVRKGYYAAEDGKEDAILMSLSLSVLQS
ncbi:ribosomal-protein-alanine acetyltransferase [Thiosulfatimonas sediminis]|uniref:Ribosomal-protein-alanine acetyltransferase n=1 Tax=Thiosulfatimonas sediminis TaxID=2675054 RepID=A0A6F8PWJ8_9GAMM|nr:ribosomal protein S18-alanine N-acetyltransferase [Thiosulfatimonas sediminis]BBP46495.1 ribosomal-protein-alanine acetyltransferase [Thiosulfatimonas sediminis]